MTYQRNRSRDQPRLFWAKTTLALGALAFVPFLGPAFAGACALAGALGSLLQSRRPARYGGRPLFLTGLALAALGTLAFFGESALFFRWKIRQAEAQRAALSRVRLDAWAGALENYRIDVGFYPETRGIALLKEQLVPVYAPDLSILDGWDRPLSLESTAFDYTLRLAPAPAGTAGGRLERHALFPVTEPPPPPAVGPPAPWPPWGSQEGGVRRAEPGSENGAEVGR